MTTHPHRSRARYRPMELVADIERRFPPAWMEADSFRARRGVPPIPEWPWWCYLPMAGWIAIASDGCPVEELQVDDVITASIMQAAGTWRMTKGIYSADRIDDVPPSAELREDMLERLPEWCMYIDLSGAWGMHGFYVSLESDVHDQRAELSFLVDLPDGLVPIPLHVGDWSVAEGFQRMEGEARRAAFDLLGRVLPEGTTEIIPLMERLVGIVCHISAPGAVISGSGTPGNPEPVKTKTGWKLFPREKVRSWKIGQ